MVIILLNFMGDNKGETQYTNNFIAGRINGSMYHIEIVNPLFSFIYDLKHTHILGDINE
jgi:hypothetical protein